MRKTPPDPLLELGKRIRTERQKLSLSQEGLAHKADLHRTYIGFVERGERNLTVRNLLRISHALGVEPGELVNRLPFKR